jgi:gamma-glutamylcyclotransferase (GGCT)/AIG2-like uncharacterized protein YtfP
MTSFSANYDPTPLGPPPDPSLPFFAYGSLRPGRLAFVQLAKRVAARWEYDLAGFEIRIRDGLPLLAPGRRGVAGTVLTFDPSAAASAYEAIGAFEPAEQYIWEILDVGGTPAWACLGREPDLGVESDPVHEWSEAGDPAFAYGLPEVGRIARRYLCLPQTYDDTDWQQFFGLQSAYLLVWSLLERVASFRYGTVAGPNKRVSALGQEPEVKSLVVELGAPSRSAYRSISDSRFPDRTIKIARDGRDALRYWYQVRSNIVHRGKAYQPDLHLLRESLVDTHDLTATLLGRWVGGLADAWGEDVGPLRPPLDSNRPTLLDGVN